MSQSMVLHQLLGGDFTYYGILKIGPSFAHEQSMTAIAKAMTKLRSLRRMVRRTGSLLALTGLFFALSLLHGEPLWSRENHIRHARQIRPYSRPYAHSSQRCAPTTVDCIADATATVTTEESTYADDEATVIHTGKSTLLWQTQKGAKQDHQNLQGSKPSNAIKDATNVWDSPSFENDSHSRVPDDPATPTDGQMDHIKGSVEETAKAISTQSTTKSQHTTDWCQGFPGAENVVVVIKTGATEVYARLAMQLLTISSCASNLLIFSDLEQDVGDFHIHDALGDIGHEYKDKCAEFELYNDLQRYHTQHESFSTLSTTKGWELDKWKNIPALHKAYQKYPDMDWYVFMDTDTYLGWSNLLKLLSRLNPNSPLYFGSIWWYGDFGFAQGGAGYVISNAGARKFEEVHDSRHITAWEDDISKNCCGDVALAMALADAGVNLTQAYPMMQCDPPSVLEWSERIWCTPAVSWHHVTPQDVDALWQFEKHWLEKSRRDEEGNRRPYLYRDAFEHFVKPRLSTTLSSWDNLSHDRIFKKPNHVQPQEDKDWDAKTNEEKWMEWAEWTDSQKASVQTPEDCRAACEADVGCMQWTWRPGVCTHSWNIRVGHSVGKDAECVSGWMLGRIEDFKKRMHNCVPVWDFNT